MYIDTSKKIFFNHRSKDICPGCGRGELIVRHRIKDNKPFLGCSRYPNCKYATNYNPPTEKIELKEKKWKVRKKQKISIKQRLTFLEDKVKTLEEKLARLL